MSEIAKISHTIISPADKWIGSLLSDEKEPKPIISGRQKYGFHILLSNPEFLSAVKAIRIKFGLPLNKNENCQSLAERLYKNVQITDLLRKFNASNRWRAVIECYVIFNKISDHLFPSNIEIKIDNQRECVLIYLNRHATTEDIKNVLPIIEKHQMALKFNPEDVAKQDEGVFYTIEGNKLKKINLVRSKKRVDFKKFDTYKKAYNLQCKGVRYIDIAKKIGLGEGSYSTVGTYLNRFKKILKENHLD